MDIWEEYKEEIKNSLRIRLLLIYKEVERLHGYVSKDLENDLFTGKEIIARTNQIKRMSEDFSQVSMYLNENTEAFIYKDEDKWRWHGQSLGYQGYSKTDCLITLIRQLKDQGYTKFRIETDDVKEYD